MRDTMTNLCDNDQCFRHTENPHYTLIRVFDEQDKFEYTFCSWDCFVTWTINTNKKVKGLETTLDIPREHFINKQTTRHTELMEMCTHSCSGCNNKILEHEKNILNLGCPTAGQYCQFCKTETVVSISCKLIQGR